MIIFYGIGSTKITIRKAQSVRSAATNGKVKDEGYFPEAFAPSNDHSLSSQRRVATTALKHPVCRTMALPIHHNKWKMIMESGDCN